MENKQEKKSNKGLIIILILIILGLGGYLVYDKVLSKGEDKTKIAEEKTDEQNIKTDKSKGYVYEADYEEMNELSLVDNQANGVLGSIDGKVPYINMNTPDALMVNNNIAKNMKKFLDQYHESETNLPEGYPESKICYGYKTYEFGDYVEIIIIRYILATSVPHPYYSSYIFNKTTGNLANNNDIFNYMKINETTFKEKLGKSIMDFIKNNYKDDYYEYNDKKITYVEANQQIVDELNKKNIGMIQLVESEMWFDDELLLFVEDNTLKVIIDLAEPVGDGNVTHMFEIK